jgi:hypothetical protein
VNDRPGDNDVAGAVEELAKEAFETGHFDHTFSFLLPEDYRWDRVMFKPIGVIKTWIAQSKFYDQIRWKHASAVVLSYCGKRVNRYNVVIRGTSQAYCLDVNLKTGAMTWKQSDSRTTALLKETLEGARR